MLFSFVIYILIFVIALIAVAFAGVYTIKSSLAVKDISGNDPDQATAQNYLIIASVICWLTVAAILVAIILYFVFAWESIEFTLSWVTWALMIFTIIVAIVIGALAAAAASKIRNSKTYTGSGASLTAYNDAIIASVIALGVSGLIVLSVLGFGIYSIYSRELKRAGMKMGMEGVEMEEFIGEGYTGVAVSAVGGQGVQQPQYVEVAQPVAVVMVAPPLVQTAVLPIPKVVSSGNNNVLGSSIVRMMPNTSLLMKQQPMPNTSLLMKQQPMAMVEMGRKGILKKPSMVAVPIGQIV